MSVSGIRSNRGDVYQTLVALDWALTVLFDPDFQWIEVDSTTIPVDDVVIGKSDGTLICCQCKKNQIDFKFWSIADLKYELVKATKLLYDNKNAMVRFYSRNDFGPIAKLREYSITQPDDANYRGSLTQEHKKTDADLAALLDNQAPNLSTYEFLRRTHFEISPDFDRMKVLQIERLRDKVCNPSIAYGTLWTSLDHLGGRMGGGEISATTQHRLTKKDLHDLLNQAGVVIAPPINITEVRVSFAGTSAIGRAWHRDIGGKQIVSPVLADLLSAIDEGKQSILLTGLPGSGKTCVMLALQETLEQSAQTRSDLVPLFIQSREFADLYTEKDRQAYGLPEHWVDKAARMAEQARVVVVIDSLDVLSIAREHAVLSYFLSQIDRLLLIPNITVVTACRDFDRRYDHRIAVRKWECELSCKHLDWDRDIIPLFNALKIQTAGIDAVTRDLIRNPRELALFVDLAQREGGSFNVITSQALAQRYFDVFILTDITLGEKAMQAIETIAEEMLKSRRLTVPRQRFSTSQGIQRTLLSLNVLQETQNGELTFGHQTLLDFLVISGALRRGVTLNEFIQSLPPVPFVRPSIRSFIAYLATGDRREFRKQIRAVLTGGSAFHIRRLVAESLAEQKPQDDDWPLIRDLRGMNREVFQVIYTHARTIEWYHFWFKHLVPVLKDTIDSEGLTAHAYHVSRWMNDDATGVLAFWTEVLQLDWVDALKIGSHLSHDLTTIDTKHMASVAPLLECLLSMPRQEHGFLGHAVARCVAAGSMDDKWLWGYVAGDIGEEDVTGFRLNNKLHCQHHEFGNNNKAFFHERMKESTSLLDLALESIERWSLIKSSRFGDIPRGFSCHFLDLTSYIDSHSQNDLRYKDNENILLDAMEAAIIHNAETHSDWWQVNRERLCFSHEEALRYFAILACTKNPEANLDVVGCILKDKDMLESHLSFELGELIQAAFRHLNIPTQDAVIDCILTIRDDKFSDEQNRFWTLKKKAELIVTIPPYLRSPEAQAVVDNYEQTMGSIVRQPNIMSRGGVVRAPFSFEVFHSVSDGAVLCLLSHYSEHEDRFSDFLIGGEREVGLQLREASSRHPTRFLHLLSTHWADISDRFRDDIMHGVAKYLAHRYGRLQINGKWEPLEEPDAPTLACYILDELERHPTHWQFNRSASNAMQSCAYVIKDTQNAARLVFLSIKFADLRDKSMIKGDSVDLINKGINMKSGHAAEAVMILAENLIDQNVPFPDLLEPTMLRFAMHSHPAIRALILRRLPYLQYHKPELGWDLFHIAMKNSTTGLWNDAESCLYHAYHNYFEKVAPMLARIQREGNHKDIETWGRISTLAALSNNINISILVNDLNTMDKTEAWKGASEVWTDHENFKRHRELCLTGIEAGLNANTPHVLVVAEQMERMFIKSNPQIDIPIELIRLCFTIFENDSQNRHNRFFRFGEWLNATSHRDPEYALDVAEIHLAYMNKTKSYLYDIENNLTQLMTRLFAEAEEREESDKGAMLKRVVSLHDMMLSLGVKGVEDWLKAAERP